MDNPSGVKIRFRYTAVLILRGFLVLHAVRIAVVGLALLGVGVLLLSLTWGTRDTGLGVLGTAMIWTMYVTFYGIRPVLQARKWMKEPGFSEEIELGFGEDAVEQRSCISEMRTEWGAFTKYVERPSFFVLRWGMRQYMVIPKDAFDNHDGLARFRDMLTRKIPGR